MMDDHPVINRLIKTGRRLGRPDIMFWSLPWLMILIVIGTIAQKNMGLYEAQTTFFSSFIFFWKTIPLPGGYTILTIIFINVLCKFLFLSIWNKSKFGIHLIHLSIIILLIGGLMTAFTMEEGYLALTEGESNAVITNYHDRVLVIDKNDQPFVKIPFEDIDHPEQWPLFALPFEIRILQICSNITILPRDDMDNNEGIGAASMARLDCITPFIENERNIAGLTFDVSGSANEEENGTYIAFENRATRDTIGDYTIYLDRAKRDLPFSILLNNFNRDVYPGTDMASEYESRVTVLDKDIKWPAIISMNVPLRYQGYTFYQASTLIDEDGQPVSVLSVVRNSGWLFPYIAGILLAMGLIYHLVWRIKGK